MPRSSDNPEGGSILRAAWAKGRKVFPSRSTSRVEPTSTGGPSGPAVQQAQLSGEQIDPSNWPPESTSRPIAKLWGEAYDQLSKKENSLVNQFEAILSHSLAEAVVTGPSLSAGALSGLGIIQSRQQIRILIEKKIEEIEKGTWKLSFRNHELRVKDLVGPVVSTIEWAKDFVGTALEVSPYASVAWAGVCVLLPLILNPSAQATAQITSLDEIAAIMSRCTLRELLYHQRYESGGSQTPQPTMSDSHIIYKDALKTLYVKILSFQVTSICHLSQNTFVRTANDVRKSNDWNSMLAGIRVVENRISSLEYQWRDMKFDEEAEKLIDRHEQRMQELSVIKEEVCRMTKIIEKAQNSAERSSFLAWLSSVDPSTNYNSARRRHTPLTGNWLIVENFDFKKWEKTPNSLIWLNGKVGTGKSFLSSSVIHHLLKICTADPHIPPYTSAYTAVAYFYFTFNEKDKQSTDNMLRSMIKQLCGRRPDLPEALAKLRQFRDVNHQPDLESLENALKESIQGFNNVYLIIDALDECPQTDGERGKLLEVLERIQQCALPNLHLFCTSRRELDIVTKLESIVSQHQMIAIDLEQSRDDIDWDIRAYIQKEIESTYFRSWPLDVKEKVVSALSRKADGMFQYVALQLKALEIARDRSAVEKALENLPDGLDETYSRALLSINPRQERHAINALIWLTFSTRSLRLEELAEASIIDPKSFSLTEDSRLFCPSDILSFLPGLVTVTTEDLPLSQGGTCQLIRLAHFSVREYLLSDRIIKSPASRFSIIRANAHVHIAESSLLYHLHVSSMECEMPIVKSLSKSFPLLEYAAQSWIEHAQALPHEHWPPSLIHLIGRALAPRSRSLLKMIQIWISWVTVESLVAEHKVQAMSPLYQYAYRRYLESLPHISEFSSEELECAPDAAITRFLSGESNHSENHREAIFELLIKVLGGPEDSIVECLVTYNLNVPNLVICQVPACSLRNFFWAERPTPTFDQETVSWSLKQMSRIATALHWIHTFGIRRPKDSKAVEDTSAVNQIPRRNRHGEVDVDAIFWFPEETQSSNPQNANGVLKIADLGLRRINNLLTDSEDTTDKVYSFTWEAPEVEVESNSSCASDMWSLATLYLEFVTWLLLGSKGGMKFSSARAEINKSFDMETDEFFTSFKDANGDVKSRIRGGVIKWVNGLHEHEKCSASIHDVLNMVMERVLLIDPLERMGSGELKQHMANLVEKAENDRQYLLSPVPRLKRVERASTY